MKQMIVLEEPLNTEVNDISEFVKEYQNIQVLKKELEVREKIYKKFLLESLPDKDKPYLDEDYECFTTEIKSKRLDNVWIKKIISDYKLNPEYNETSFKKITIKRRVLK